MFKKLIATAALAACSVGAQAAATTTTQTVVDIDGGTFNAILDEITVSSLSNVFGTLTFNSGSGSIDLGMFVFNFTLSNPTGDVTVGLGSAGSFTAQPTGYSFSFNNVAAGTYNLSVKGLNDTATAVSATYSVTAVPEPETYAMMLAGLGAIGFLSRRRKAGAVAQA